MAQIGNFRRMSFKSRDQTAATDRQKALTDALFSEVWSRKGLFREVSADIAAKTDRP